MGMKGFQDYTNLAGLERKQWRLDQEGGGFGENGCLHRKN